jgi:hypothetical protein
MQIASPLAVCLVSLCLGSSLAFGQGELWIVDKAGGPGFVFTEIQPAVDAAADGDTVLVRSGVYSSFTIDGKALVVTRDPISLSPPSVSDVRVLNLAAGQEVVVRGMTIAGGTFGGCFLDHNDGPVWLESLVIPPGGCFFFYFATGLRAQACSAVIATRCTFSGGLSTKGISASDSSLYLFETSAFAGKGGSGAGPAGVEIIDSFLLASGGTFQGGCGADGGECIAGSPGGPGLKRVGGPLPQILGTALVGGPGGCGISCGGCGSPGADAVGGYELVAGFPRDYVLGSPASSGQTTTLAYSGKPGDLVFSLIGLDQSALYIPELAGALVVPIPPLLIAHGPADAAGKLNLLVTLPSLPPGVEAITVYAQAAAVSSVGAAVLGAPSQLTIL